MVMIIMYNFYAFMYIFHIIAGLVRKTLGQQRMLCVKKTFWCAALGMFASPVLWSCHIKQCFILQGVFI